MKWILIFTLMMSMFSCTVVQDYEKIKLNDPDMVLSSSKTDRFETNFQTYREASSGGNGGKTGGGCGCN